MSAFTLFSKDARAKFRKACPDATYGELSKMVMDDWRTMSRDGRELWQERSEKERRVICPGRGACLKQVDWKGDRYKAGHRHKHTTCPHDCEPVPCPSCKFLFTQQLLDSHRGVCMSCGIAVFNRIMDEFGTRRKKQGETEEEHAKRVQEAWARYEELTKDR